MLTRQTNIQKKDTLIYALGGLGQVGKNMTCFEHEDEILIIDCGVLFPDENLLGVNYVIPNFNALYHNKKKKYLVVTHGHEDHIGGIPFLLKNIKIDCIYAARFTIALIERKLEEHHLLDTTKIVEIDSKYNLQTKHFQCGFFSVVHSIPDSYGVIINTKNGRIIHTGDFKFDLTPVGSDPDYPVMSFIGQVGVDLLLSDSTNSQVRGFSISEAEVSAQINQIMHKTKGRLIVATFASNVYRVAQILNAAVKHKRKIVIYGRSMENVVNIARKLKFIDLNDNNFAKKHELNHLSPDKICIVCTGSQGEPLAALSRIAAGTHRQIHLRPSDTIVFSSSPIPGNQNSVNKVVNQLIRKGANVLTKSIFTDLHTTGHASCDEQKLMLQLMKPVYFMPVHGEYKMQLTHAKTAIATGVKEENISICDNGDVSVLRDGHLYKTGTRVEGEDVYIDGKDYTGLSTTVIKDRRILSKAGLVSVIVNINSHENLILAKPIIVTRGFVYIKESQELLSEAEKIVYECVKNTMSKKTTFLEIKNAIKFALEGFFYQKTHRNPIVIPVILNYNQEK